MMRNFSIAMGVILLAIGLWGMFTGGYAHEMAFLTVNAAQNVLHIVTGGFAIIAGLSGRRPAANTAIALGLVYGLLSVLGLFSVAPVIRALALNVPDNWLHLGVGAACLWLAGSDVNA